MLLFSGYYYNICTGYTMNYILYINQNANISGLYVPKAHVVLIQFYLIEEIVHFLLSFFLLFFAFSTICFFLQHFSYDFLNFRSVEVKNVCTSQNVQAMQACDQITATAIALPQWCSSPIIS